MAPVEPVQQGEEDDDYQFDDFNEGVMKDVKRVQKTQLHNFVTEYSKQLSGISQTLEFAADNYWESCNIPPVSVGLCADDNVTYEQVMMTATPSEQVNKVFLVFASLCEEVRVLKATANETIYPSLLLYGEDCSDVQQDENDSANHEKITKLLPFILELSQFVQRCNDVFSNFMRQLAAVYPGDKSAKKSVLNGVHMVCLLENLSSLLGILLRLDEIIAFNHTLTSHWGLYKRMIKSIIQSPGMFDADVDKVYPLEKWIEKVEGELFDGTIFQDCITMPFENSGTLFLNNKNLRDEFLHGITSLVSKAEGKLPSNEFSAKNSITSMVLLYVLYYQLFRDFDVKFNKRIFEILKKIVGVNLIGPKMWYPPEFILDLVPPAAKSLDKKTMPVIEASRNTAVKDAAGSLPKQIEFFTVAVTQWVMEYESCVTQTSTVVSPITRTPETLDELLDDSKTGVRLDKRLSEDLNSRTKCVIKGLKLARTISSILRTLIPLHADQGVQMGARVALHLLRLVELLKTLQHTFGRMSHHLNKWIAPIVQHLQYSVIGKIKPTLDKIGVKDWQSETGIAVSSLRTVEKLLLSAATNQKLLAIDIIQSYGVQKLRSNFKEEDIAGIFESCNYLSSVLNLNQLVLEACDCMLLQWARACIPVYLGAMLTCKLKPNSSISNVYPTNTGVPLLFSALRDITMWMDKCGQLSPDLRAALEREILADIENSLLKPLCVEIETDLRYSTHVHLKVKDGNPLKQGVVTNDFKPLLQLKPFRFMEHYVNVPERVAMHLNHVFYNLTTITPQDWQAYTAMKFCAQARYGGLTLMDSKLPQQTIEQGLDVLEIMRNIHLFVGQYLYNLNNQIFIEQANSSNRHLNTINITHVANSMRTHGTGIMNTTVNYTFQYLRKKFLTFSQFLYDEQIKGKLIKEIRFFREKKDSIDQRYPYDRAEKFNKNIRKLGLAADKSSYLDQFRRLISQIGNAMGFVRMIRSGGLNTCSRAIEFVPDLDDIVSFEEEVRAESLSAETLEAAKNFDTVLGNLSKNFAEGTDYFNLFLSVFAPPFRSANNVHLRNFYIIVPALMINFVEYIKQSKEQMMKKNKTGALFTDDGFAMGVAFILALLEQSREFDSLHWFDSVRAKLAAEMRDTQTRQKAHTVANTREDHKQSQAADLTFRRIDMYQKEFDLLFFSFSSARIFFQQHDPEHDDLTSY